jgi:ABC-2 type transport system ATP-binding protein
MKSLASQGRTVFLSSHVMSEMAQTADHLLIIGRGRIIADTSVADLVGRQVGDRVRVRSTDQSHLAQTLAHLGAGVEPTPDGAIVVTGLDSIAISAAAAAGSFGLIELTPQTVTLEDAFFGLTADMSDYQAAA